MLCIRACPDALAVLYKLEVVKLKADVKTAEGALDVANKSLDSFLKEINVDSSDHRLHKLLDSVQLLSDS